MADRRKTAIVTGGSRGIGREVALRLASLDYDIAIVYVGDPNEAAETVSECTKKGVRAVAYVCNVASFEETKETVNAITKDFGGDSIEVLVNNAGITRDGLIAMMSEENWDSVGTSAEGSSTSAPSLVSWEMLGRSTTRHPRPASSV